MFFTDQMLYTTAIIFTLKNISIYLFYNNIYYYISIRRRYNIELLSYITMSRSDTLHDKLCGLNYIWYNLHLISSRNFRINILFWLWQIPLIPFTVAAGFIVFHSSYDSIIYSLRTSLIRMLSYISLSITRTRRIRLYFLLRHYLIY